MNWKTLSLAVLCCVAPCATSLIAQSDSVHNATGIHWATDYDAALQTAKTDNKPLFVFFTGSDWCSWCMRLKQEVLDTPEFIQKVQGKFVFVELDFPMNQSQPAQQVAQNEALKERFQIQGFPTIVLVRPDGTTIATMGYLAGGGSKYAQNVLDVLGASK